jgi:hypothetical protein
MGAKPPNSVAATKYIRQARQPKTLKNLTYSASQGKDSNMAVDEKLKSQYEKDFWENQPGISAEETRARNIDVVSLRVTTDMERFAVKLLTNNDQYLFHINPVAARALAILLLKGIDQIGWAQIEMVQLSDEEVPTH